MCAANDAWSLGGVTRSLFAGMKTLLRLTQSLRQLRGSFADVIVPNNEKSHCHDDEENKPDHVLRGYSLPLRETQDGFATLLHLAHHCVSRSDERCLAVRGACLRADQRIGLRVIRGIAVAFEYRDGAPSFCKGDLGVGGIRKANHPTPDPHVDVGNRAVPVIGPERAAVREAGVERLDSQRRVQRGELGGQRRALPVFLLARLRFLILREGASRRLERIVRAAQPYEVDVVGRRLAPTRQRASGRASP